MAGFASVKFERSNEPDIENRSMENYCQQWAGGYLNCRWTCTLIALKTRHASHLSRPPIFELSSMPPLPLNSTIFHFSLQPYPSAVKKPSISHP